MAFPTAGVADNFTRANQNPLGTASNGNTWAVTPDQGGLGLTGMEIISNRCAGLTTANFMYLPGSYGTDTESAITVDVLGGTGAFVDVACRLGGTGSSLTLTGYAARWTINAGTDTIQIIRIASGAATVLTTYNQEVSAGDSFGLSVIGSTLEAYYKAGAGAWVSLGSTTDATYGSAGVTAITVTSSIARLSNFIAGAYVPSSTYLPRMGLMGVG